MTLEEIKRHLLKLAGDLEAQKNGNLRDLRGLIQYAIVEIIDLAIELEPETPATVEGPD